MRCAWDAESLCKRLREEYNIADAINDIYTKEDAEFLACNEVLTPDRIVGAVTTLLPAAGFLSAAASVGGGTLVAA